MPTDADVLIIGSGAGGLGAALALARAGLRVTICEAHEIPGGYSQSFTLDGLRFSPGIHYVGELGPGEGLRRIYEGLGLGGEVEFCELAPRSYVHITLGQRTYPLVKGRAALEAHLAEEFPGEAAGIGGYLDQVQHIGRVLRGDGLQPVADRAALGALGPWAHRTAQRLIEAHVEDRTLRGLFGAIAGEYGLAPSLAPATVHALTACHYLEGAYYPRGGGGGLVKAMVRAIKRAGGELRLSAPVARILTDEHRVAGVELLDGTRLHARHVISNADPGVTWRSLLAGHPAAEAARQRLSRVRWSVSTLSFFLALDRSPAAWGLDSGNHWLFPDEDVDGAFRSIAGASLETLADGPLFLSFPTLKDPSLPRGRRHTLEAFTFAPWPLFHRWHDTTPEARGPEYEAFKRRALDRVLSRAEHLLPGLRDHLAFANVGTPLTSARFVRASQGHMYGLEKNPLQVGGASFPVRPGVEGLDGLWLCGAGTLTHGVHGATLSGLVAAAGILGVRVADLLTGDRPVAVHPSDDLSAWPPELQEQPWCDARRSGGTVVYPELWVGKTPVTSVNLVDAVIAAAPPASARLVHDGGTAAEGATDRGTPPGDDVRRLYRLATLLRPGALAEGMRTVDQRMAARPIRRGAEVSPLRDHNGSAAALPSTYVHGGRSSSIEAFLERTGTTGLIVLRGDTILFERYYQGTTAASRTMGWSLSKSVVSALIGLAVGEGLIRDIREPVSLYVPKLVGSGFDGVSIKDVLQMSSGLRVEVEKDDGKDAMAKLRIFSALLTGGPLDDLAASIGSARPPGTHHQYHSVNTVVLGMVLRAVAGRSIAQYAEEKLWGTLGMEADASWLVDEAGIELAPIGLSAVLRDQARFGLLYLRNGRARDRQILPEQWVRTSVTPDAAHLVPGKRDLSDWVEGYGYHWWIPQEPDGDFMALGSYGQAIYVSPRHDIVIARSAAYEDYSKDGYEMEIEATEVFKAISRNIG